MRRREMRALSLALTASIVVSGIFTGVDVFAAEKNNEVVQQMVVETLPKENETEKETEQEPAGIVSVEELDNRKDTQETEEVSQQMVVEEQSYEETEEEIASYLAVDNSALVSSVIDNEILLNALIQKVKPDATKENFTYGDLRAYSGDLDLGNVNFSSVPQGAFFDCKMTSVTLPDGITSIGENAFGACSNLEHVNSTVANDTLPSKLQSVGMQAFQQCTSLTKIIIPNLQNGEALGLATAMFYGCTSLCEVEFGDNIKFIPADAFDSCGTAGEGMKIQFGKGLVNIMEKAFIGSKQTGIIDLSQCSELSNIGASAFKSVSNLTTVKLPEKTAGLRIGSEAFACPNEDKAPFLSTMGAGANPQAEQIILPEYVTELGSGCFYGNTAVTSVQISSKITYIGEYTFDGCKSLENVTFTGNQSAVTSIGDCAFRNTLTDASFLQYLTKLKVIGTQHIEESVEKENNDSKNSIGRMIASLELGGQGSVVDDAGQRQNNKKDKLVCGSEVFTNCVRIKNVVLPVSVEEVGSRAFYFDDSTPSNIETITWLSDNTSNAKRTIYSEAFRGNQKMTSLILPVNAKELEIQAYAFCGDKSLTKLTEDGGNILPQSLQSIGWGAFYACSSLKNITIQNKADGTSPILGKKAFEGCRSLSEVTLPESLTEIPLRCFANCSLTKMPSGPARLETIGELSFFGNPFETLDLSEFVYVTKINCSAFAYVDMIVESDREDKNYNIALPEEKNRTPALKTVILPNNADLKGETLFIQSGAFGGQENLTTMQTKTPAVGYDNKIYIPDYIAEIGYGVFAYTGVTGVIWEADTTGKNQWTTIPKQMYQGCTKIQRAEDVLPKGSYVENLGRGVFNHSLIKSADLSMYTSLKVVGSGTWTIALNSTAGVFGGCGILTSVKLPENTEITLQEYTFATDKVRLPDDTEIELASLTNVSLGGTTVIGKDAFLNQTNLSEITIPESVTDIKDSAFENCTGLTNVSVSGNNSIKNIEMYAFYGCKSLVLTNSNLLEGVEVIGDSAFYECDSLGSVTFGEKLTSIGNNAFAKKNWVKGTGVTAINVKKAKQLTKIGNNAFEKTGLETADISGTQVAMISQKTFFDCQDLKTVVFGEEVEYIDNNALAGCCSLNRIDVSPMATISSKVFNDRGTNKDTPFTAQTSNNLSINISTPKAIVVPLGREMDLPFYTTVNETLSESSYGYVVMAQSNAVLDELPLKVSACLADGCYKNSFDKNNKIEPGDFYEKLQKPYAIKVKRAGQDRSNIETIRLTGLKATNEVISLTLKGQRSFETADKMYTIDVADYGVTYQVSVEEKQIVPVLYSDYEKTVAVPSGQGISAPLNISGNKSTQVFYKLEDMSGSGETLDTNNIVVETSDTLVLYPAASPSAAAPEDNKYIVKGNNGSGSFYLTTSSVGTATITVYPEGYPQYKHVYTYKVDSFIWDMKLSIPEEYSKANPVGTAFNVFESYMNYMNQTVNKENMDMYSVYSGFTGEIRYTSDEPEYVSVDNEGNINILKADERNKTVRITATYPRSVSGTGYNMANATVNIQIAGNNTAGGNTTGGNTTGGNTTGGNTTGGNTTGGNTTGGNTTGGNTTNSSTSVAIGKETKDDSSGATVIPTIVGKEDLQGEVKYVMPASTAATEVVVPDTVTLNGVRYKVTDVDVKAFKGNTRITAVTLGQYVTKIGEEAFSGCTALKKIVIPASVTRIENKAFYNCSKLAKVTIPSNSALVDIGDSAFYNCKALTSITIPKKVTTIQAKAFYNCKKLKKITIKSTVLKNVGKNAFKNIHSKATIKVPKSKLSAYKKLLKSKGQKKSVKIKK